MLCEESKISYKCVEHRFATNSPCRKDNPGSGNTPSFRPITGSIYTVSKEGHADSLRGYERTH